MVLVVVMVKIHNFLTMIPNQPEDYMAVAVLDAHQEPEKLVQVAKVL